MVLKIVDFCRFFSKFGIKKSSTFSADFDLLNRLFILSRTIINGY